MTVPVLVRRTVPLGTGPDGGRKTFTVNVTVCPNALGLGELERKTLGGGPFTTCWRVEDDPPTKLVFPLYTASKRWLPWLLKAVVRVATPEELTRAVPRLVLPSAKITEPGSALFSGNFGWMVAVSVNGCFILAGLLDEASASV